MKPPFRRSDYPASTSKKADFSFFLLQYVPLFPHARALHMQNAVPMHASFIGDGEACRRIFSGESGSLTGRFPARFRKQWVRKDIADFQPRRSLPRRSRLNICEWSKSAACIKSERHQAENASNRNVRRTENDRNRSSGLHASLVFSVRRRI